MEQAAHGHGAHGGHGERFRKALPQRDEGADARICSEAVVELRPVGVVQHIHDMGAADPWRVVETGIRETARLQVDDPLRSVFRICSLVPNWSAPVGQALMQAGSMPHRHPVGTEGAFVDFAVLLRKAGDVEGAAGDAVAAPDAVLLMEVHNAVGVLDDGARRGAGHETSGVLAVHTAVFADQPFQPVSFFAFGIAHDRPGRGGEVGRVVVDAAVGPYVVADVIPLQTGRLAGLAADAGGDVDQLGDLLPCVAPTGLGSSLRNGV